MVNSRRKGNAFEYELVNEARSAGLEAERAYASNGRALGEVEACDLRVADVRISAKRRKMLAELYQVPGGCDAVVFRQDRGETLAMVRWDWLLDRLAALEHYRNQHRAGLSK
jgi:hypothetical protein